MSALSLPPALAPWTPWLELFPAELALSLGPMIQRLAAALGPLAAPAQGGLGEPDGFGGLDRRGLYERLLASEWLLADLAPDEFLRRAAAGEHAFLRLERREPALARASVVLFDAGPAQLGGPRIAHLAALVAFARRAEAAGAALGWGLLQEPDVPLVGAVERATVRALLARRTAVAVAPAHLERWRQCLSGHVAKDIWFVGDPGVAVHAWPGVATVALHEPIGVGPLELAARLRTAAGRVADVRLPLPPGPHAVRLVRDPFPPDAPAPPPAARRRTRRIPVTNLVISNNGERVFAGARGGGVIAYPVPHSGHGGVGKPKLHFAHLPRAPEAVGWVHRGCAAVTVDAGSMTLHRKAHRSATSPETLRFPRDRPDAVPGAELRLLRFRDDRAIFHDLDGRLHALGRRDGSPHCERLAEHVLAVADGPEWLAYVAQGPLRADDPSSRAWAVHVERRSQPRRRFVLDFESPIAAHFARTAAGEWQCAVAHAAGRWRLHAERGPGVAWSIGERVVGLLAAHHLGPSAGRGPALVALASDRDFVTHQGGEVRHLTTADAPVVHAALSTVTGHLAYVTARNAVVVLRPPFDVPLARFVVEDA